MRKIIKWIGIIIGCLVLIITIATVLMQFKTYNRPYPNIKASTNPILIERGKYLVLGPAHCADCHGSENERTTINNGKDIPLSGGRVFKMPIGEIHVPNITPDNETGIGNHTDGEIARALRYGVDSKGKALFPIMPFQNLSDEDLTAIISYLRSASPKKKNIPGRNLNPLGYAVTSFLIKPIGPEKTPPAAVTPDSTAAYGAYIANSIANCRGCHTNRDMITGEFTGKPFSGGLKMEKEGDGDYSLITPNLTPDKATGHIANWNEQIFINRFHKGRIIKGSHMPWEAYSRMKERDLKAIYKYLQTIPAVNNKVSQVMVKNE